MSYLNFQNLKLFCILYHKITCLFILDSLQNVPIAPSASVAVSQIGPVPSSESNSDNDENHEVNKRPIEVTDCMILNYSILIIVLTIVFDNLFLLCSWRPSTRSK